MGYTGFFSGPLSRLNQERILLRLVCCRLNPHFYTRCSKWDSCKSIHFCARCIIFSYTLSKIVTSIVSMVLRMFFLISPKSVRILFANFALQVSTQVKITLWQIRRTWRPQTFLTAVCCLRASWTRAIESQDVWHTEPSCCKKQLTRSWSVN